MKKQIESSGNVPFIGRSPKVAAKNKERHWVIRFRFLPPEEMMTPRYHLPLERMGVWAATKEAALEKFYEGIKIRDDYRIESVEEEER